jgi:ClpP class serine protease
MKNETEPQIAESKNVSEQAEKKHSIEKTPLYRAQNAERYRRQELIKEIQLLTGNRLICYVSSSDASIERDDVLGFVDLLHNVGDGKNVDLLIQTGGGDPDAAEKIICLIRSVTKTANFRVVVPDMAKSAGTLIAIGADKIVMSDSSELGPIDPQALMQDNKGNYAWHPVQSYLDAFDELTTLVNSDPEDMASRLLLAQLDPTKRKLYQAVMKRTRELAEKLLKDWMLANPKEGVAYTKVASLLMETKTFPSHSQVVGYKEALSMNLSVEYLERESNEWKLYWELYCLQRIALKGHGKLFESDYASILVADSIV